MRVLLFGVAFGFILSRAGATDGAAIVGMFRLTDLHLAGVIGVAVALNALAFAWLRGPGRRRFEHKPMVPGLALGALLFGAGWAISASCPGTALAQLGEGRLSVLFTLGGILLGTWLASRRAPATVTSSPGTPRATVRHVPAGVSSRESLRSPGAA